MEPLQFFNTLKGRLKHAEREVPAIGTLALGFTKSQMMKMSLKKPRLVWYDAATKTFYDQGDSTKIKKSDWTKVDQFTFKKNAPMKDLQYYIPINSAIVSDSNQVNYKR